jgi:hypothetical protein
MFMNFEIPDDIAQETGITLTRDIKKKILGLNAARLYNIDVPTLKATIQDDAISRRLREVS